MKHYTQKVVPEHTKAVESHVTCDSCGLVIPEPKDRGVCHVSDDIRIERAESESWPGSSTGKTIEIDCCPACWEAKILPLFPNVKARDWY